MHAQIENAERQREDRKTVEKTNIGRAVLVGGVQMFAVSTEGTVTSGSQALERYTPTTVADMVGWAMAAR